MNARLLVLPTPPSTQPAIAIPDRVTTEELLLLTGKPKPDGFHHRIDVSPGNWIYFMTAGAWNSYLDGLKNYTPLWARTPARF